MAVGIRDQESALTQRAKPALGPNCLKLLLYHTVRTQAGLAPVHLLCTQEPVIRYQRKLVYI